MLIDTHCHLDAAEFDADREAVLVRARAAGVGALVVPAVERANFGAVSALCREYLECRAAYGIHPLFVDRARDEDLDALRRTLSQEPALAVGEIGLDRFVESRDDARQERFFVAQLEIAREAELPVILHVRRAIDLVLKHLRRIPVVGGIAHAFNGSRQQADAFIELGFKLGFGGAMTHPRALRIRELAATLPLDALVLETDAPDIPPEWLGRGRNEPAELPRIAAVLAQLRRLNTKEVAVATSCNARQTLPGLSVIRS
ncbi:DNAase [Denitratisoma sp. DHT3]|uniref:TatD family hydrolase n=1 Tax=Denitratisoma sp. DHT3 TaxID=1981880 RepID=UPI001198588E|nr:TatD family hydrolase [Denitratisoma sp. DHT3]QDX79860.1 DNAase [Denitratisoma sp. DHT3]